ncbi:MarR family EPS-associated transcriptional regulator [Thiohalophilus sp.]|uniref:MarR family EPS-associated transcriptional regulator n=1 Tax=Thiohalophilus sp. TaxID=3028392 RepID=UPI002ACD7266|nr:MarR family EPS-associated transcriptional regulator [Thiohalophilus sp.]MDZ7662782.1 MarR family EPS-associated transcriptional regulator [Thiohalophilus sp.]
MLTDETRYKLLKLLEQNPGINQRELASELGISLGKTNYCLKALIDKGWVKAGNFRQNPRKMHYAYLLTPRGLEEKARVTLRFLKRKQEEYEQLVDELEELREEAAALKPLEEGEG